MNKVGYGERFKRINNVKVKYNDLLLFKIPQRNSRKSCEQADDSYICNDILLFQMFLGPHQALSARKVLLCSTLLWPMVTSPGNLWTMETWVPCPCVKICAVNHTNATWHLWRENVVSLFTATARRSVCGCRPKTTNTCYSFLISLVPTVFQSAVSKP